MAKSLDEIIALLKQGVGQHLHWFSDDVALRELAAVLCGMANASGGRVLLGISPARGEVVGVRRPQEALDRVFQAALQVEPPLVLPLPQVHGTAQGEVVSVTVPPGLPHVYHLQGRYLIRQGARTETLAPSRLRALLMQRGVVQFEAQIPESARLDDLDMTEVEAYRAALDLPPGDSPWELLFRRGCLRRLEGELRPTYAALLLFGRQPQRWVPSAQILAARFSGTAIGDQFVKQEIDGTLPQQLRRAEAFARDHLRRVARLSGLQRQETPEYPLAAVRELLVNAVAHRDYNQQGDTIHLHIFADRLEVRSPGGLPGPVTLENLLEARFSRNPVIAQVLSDLGFVERLGYGLNRVVTALQRYHLPQPRFEEAAGAFRVTLFNALEGPDAAGPAVDLSAYQGLRLNPRQELALGHLLTHRRLTSKDYQKLCPEVSAETLRRDLSDLVTRGVLLKMGSKRGTYYILR